MLLNSQEIAVTQNSNKTLQWFIPFLDKEKSEGIIDATIENFIAEDYMTRGEISYRLYKILLKPATPTQTPIQAPTPTQISTIDFAGYTWKVKKGTGGPGPNNWNNYSDAVFTDSENQLHLVVKKTEGSDKFYSSEVSLPSSLGYGLYKFEIASRVDQIDQNLVAAPFLYQDDDHEIDIEFSRWTNPTGKNYQYVIQPFKVEGNRVRYNLNLDDSPSTYEINWQPDSIQFRAVQNGIEMHQWAYTGANNFTPGREKVHINFWMYQGLSPIDTTKDHEFIIKDFSFTPFI